MLFSLFLFILLLLIAIGTYYFVDLKKTLRRNYSTDGMNQINLNERLRFDWLDLISYAYIYSNIILFLLTWIKLRFSVPMVLLLLYGILCLTNKRTKFHNLSRRFSIRYKYLCCMLIAFGLILIWCFCSGLGGFVSQSGDWTKHNIIFRDLVTKSWPVRFQFGTESGVLTYYIAQYLLPAAVGKIVGIDAAQTFMLLWSAIGIFIICYEVNQLYGNGKNGSIIITIGLTIMFGTLIGPLTEIYRFINPNDAANGYHWISQTVLIQYSHNIIMLRWVFPQFIVPFLAVSMFMKHRYDYRHWGMIAVPVILYSTFAFIGFAGLMLIVFLCDLADKKYFEKMIKIFAKENIIAFMLGIILCAYISCNIIQNKPVEAGMVFEVINYSHNWFLLILFQLSWFIWILVIYKKERKNHLLFAASLILALLPFFKFGMYNDLCMRSSIPALCIVCILVIKSFYINLEKNIWHSVLIIIMLCLAAAKPVHELKTAVISTDWGSRTYEELYSGTVSQDYYEQDLFIKYQYIDWEQGNLSSFLLQ